MHFKYPFLLFFIMLLSNAQAQNKGIQYPPANIYSGEYKGISKALKDVLPYQSLYDGRLKEIQNKTHINKITNPFGLPIGVDPVKQKFYNQRKLPLNTGENFEGMSFENSSGASPPDPSGAIGPNHYFQVVNQSFAIFDRNGNTILAPASISTIWNSASQDFSDPIVLYDVFANRWVVMAWDAGINKLNFAISTTSDPTGTYHTYVYNVSNFPDYPKVSIWYDGYYLTSNSGSEQLMVFPRDQMLTGNAGQMIGFDIPSLPMAGFTSPLVADAQGTLPTSSTPAYVFYYNDDSWGLGGGDALLFWEVNINWANINLSTISSRNTIAVSPFSTDFGNSWNNIPQPNTNQKLDGIIGAMMYRVVYRKFGTHASFVMNHTVDVDGTNHAGIRWYEVRDNNFSGTLSLYQEGTYSPDSKHRWMGSIGMDNQGNIGLAYSLSSTSVFPSLAYCGRLSTDPLGQMTFSETSIVSGSNSQTFHNRYGDYSHLSIDPNDDRTFWYTGEYINSFDGSWDTRICSFTLAGNLDTDVGISAITNPNSGVLGSSENLTVQITNYGLLNQNNIPIFYILNGTASLPFTYSGTINAGASAIYTFPSTLNLSAIGSYDLEVCTSLSGDLNPNNNCYSKAVVNGSGNDVGVSIINSPNSGLGLSNAETVTITLSNYGNSPVSTIPVQYQINGAPAVNETFTGTINPGSTASFVFFQKANLSAYASYTITAKTNFSGDMDPSNDATGKIVDHFFCQPTSNCNFGDKITHVSIGSLDNTTACANQGYSDFTTLTAPALEKGNTYDLEVNSSGQNLYGSVWIDLNNNFMFENGEQMEDGLLYDFSFTSPLYIDPNWSVGEHLLRVRSIWNKAASDGCSEETYGETEDYKIEITFPLKASDHAQTKPLLHTWYSALSEELVVNLKNYTGNFDLKIYSSNGQLLNEKSFFASAPNWTQWLNTSTYSSGHYLLHLSGENLNKIDKFIIP